MTVAPFEASRTHPLGTDRLRGKIAVVTGAGQGIGRATARRLAHEGAIVVVADLSDIAAERTLGELRAMGATAEKFVGDLLVYENCAALIDFAVTRFGRIDVLVNNVGGATDLKPYYQWDPQAIQDEMNRSILPTLWCCRAALPHMHAQRYGRIVNVGAESARNGLWDRAPYNAGKGAVIGITTRVSSALPATASRPGRPRPSVIAWSSAASAPRAVIPASTGRRCPRR